MVLVDTSVLINFLRGKETPSVIRLSGLVDLGFCITPVVLHEVLQGSRNQSDFKTLKSYLETQLFCYPLHSIATYEKAALLFVEARQKGLTIRSSVDCLIAQIAIENNIPLLHDDKDFDAIASISELRIFT